MNDATQESQVHLWPHIALQYTRRRHVVQLTDRTLVNGATVSTGVKQQGICVDAKQLHTLPSYVPAAACGLQVRLCAF